jgi:hypothetical protein
LFWQNADDSLTGYKTQEAIDRDTGTDLVLLHVQLEKCSEPDNSGYCNAPGFAIVERTQAECSGTGVCLVTYPVRNSPRSTLLNLLHAPVSSHLSKVAALFTKIESLGYVLAWSLSGEEDMAVDLIELPRLKLSFKAIFEDGELRFYCREHAGLFISTENCPDSEILMYGLPCALLLTNHVKERFILVNSAVKPVKPPQSVSFPSVLLLDRQDKDWISNLSAKHYLYPLHLSKRFLQMPSLPSMLYLLVLRFYSRNYEEIFKMANSCVSDTELSKEEMQVLIAKGLAYPMFNLNNRKRSFNVHKLLSKNSAFNFACTAA